MFKFLAVSLFVLCTIESGLPLKCYQCGNCGKQSAIQQTCTMEGARCATLIITRHYKNGSQREVVWKGCLPEMNDQSCVSVVEDTLRKDARFSEQEARKFIQRPDISLRCDFCRDQDICNKN